MPALFVDAPDLRRIAEKLVATRPEVKHVELDEVLFFWDLMGKPKRVLAHCYSFTTHPIMYFVECRFGVVVYEQNTDHMTPQQIALLILHEMMHIPKRGDKLVDHTIQDFGAILGIGGVDWAAPGAVVPDLMGEI